MPKGREAIALSQAAGVSFHDSAFRTRTLVFPDGETATVEKGLVAVSDQEHIAYLDRHADFERIDGSA